MITRKSLIASAVLASTAAATLVIASGPDLSYQQDLPIKIHMAELVIGATDGLTEIGWTNAEIEDRVAALAVKAEPYRDDDLRATGKAQALEGRWGDEILIGYLNVIERPAAEILNTPSVEEVAGEYRELRETRSGMDAVQTLARRYEDHNAFAERVVLDRIHDVSTWQDRVVETLGLTGTDVEIAAATMVHLGYVIDPIKSTDINPQLLTAPSGRAYLDSRHAKDPQRPAGSPAAREPVVVDLVSTPGSTAM